MKIKIYSVYDAKTKVYGQPNFLLNMGAATRAWTEAANDRTMSIGRHPADYTMFEIGEWDDESGVIKMHEAKISLGCAIEFVDKQITNLTPVEAEQ